MVHPVDIHVGKKLRLRRNNLNMSQQELAKNVGVTFQQVQKYEHGVNRISCSRLYEFAQTLKMPVVYFFEGMGFQQLDNPALGVADAEQKPFVAMSYQPDRALQADEQRLLEAYRNISDKKSRHYALQVIESLNSAK